MRIKRLMRRMAVLVTTAAAAAAVLYLLAIRIPSYYKPRRLTMAEQEDGLRRFVNHTGRFCSDAGAGKPFTWTLTAEQANLYLASADSIASFPGRPLHPSARLAEAGFEDPAVAMRDGKLTLAVRSRRHNKILSLDLQFQLNASGELTARISAARIGSLPVPRSLLAEHIANARRQLDRRLAEACARPENRVGPIRLDELAAILRRVMEMTDGKYVSPVIVSPPNGHRSVVKDIRITPGRLTLHCEPAPPARSAPSAVRSPA